MFRLLIHYVSLLYLCPEVPQISLTHTILIEVLTNAMSVPLPILDLIEEKVKHHIKSLGDQDVM